MKLHTRTGNLRVGDVIDVTTPDPNARGECRGAFVVTAICDASDPRAPGWDECTLQRWTGKPGARA